MDILSLPGMDTALSIVLQATAIGIAGLIGALVVKASDFLKLKISDNTQDKIESLVQREILKTEERFLGDINLAETEDKLDVTAKNIMDKLDVSKPEAKELIKDVLPSVIDFGVGKLGNSLTSSLEQ